jgi:predicted amidophosphoribosyltransferase
MQGSSAPVAAESEVCSNCGNFVPQLDTETGWCAGCAGKQVRSFLESNADHIEHYILQGLTVGQSISRVAMEIRPVCAVCGKPMQRAKRTAVICRRTAQCRKISRRYVYLHSEKGLSKAEALAKALDS